MSAIKMKQAPIFRGFFLLTGIFLVLFVLLVGETHAYPTRPITVIAPFAPGGGTVREMRVLAPYLTKILGQNVIVKPVPGAGTTLGTMEASRAKADGYTLVCNPLPHTIMAQELHGTTSKLENFKYIYGWFEGTAAVAVLKDAPYQTFADMVAASNKKPLKISVAGIGSHSHLISLLMDKYTGLHSSLVPYQGGGPASTAFLRGDVDFTAIIATTLVRHIRSGKARSLLILGPNTLKAFPGVPSSDQLGFKDMPYIPFVRGVSAPPGTPDDRLKILEAAFSKAVADPTFVATMEKMGTEITPRTGKELQEYAKVSLDITMKFLPLMKAAKKKK